MTRGLTLSAYLKDLRGPLTQKAAGARAKLPGSAEDARVLWNKLERGKLGLGIINAQRIAEGFNRPIEELTQFVTTRGDGEEILATLERIESRLSWLEDQVDRDDPQSSEDGDE